MLLFTSSTVTSGDSSKALPTLAPGDIVEVREGQLMHLQGKVINVEGDVITIMPKHEDLKVHLKCIPSLCTVLVCCGCGISVAIKCL